MDNWIAISTYILKGSWKSFIFTCKSFYSLNSDEELDKRRSYILIDNSTSNMINITKHYN